MFKIKFIDKEHREFFKEKYNSLQGYRKTDVYYLSLIYLLGIDENTRNNFNKIFDIDKGEINIEALHCPWQTSSSEKVTRLAFNLWNSCNYDSREDYFNDKYSSEYNPSNIFCCSYAPYFYEGIKLRFPEYTRTLQNENELENE